MNWESLWGWATDPVHAYVLGSIAAQLVTLLPSGALRDKLANILHALCFSPQVMAGKPPVSSPPPPPVISAGKVQ